MELKDIKNLNQRIYELDDAISRESKVLFIAALVFALKGNTEFQNVSKLTNFIDFTNGVSKSPIDQLLELAKVEIDSLNLQSKTKGAIINSLESIGGSNTNLNNDKTRLKEFIQNFISSVFPLIKPGDLFFETLYMEIDKKSSNSNSGIILTPTFAAQLMVDLAELDYKTDVLADLCAGTGLFSLLAYSNMLDAMNSDYNKGLITRDEYKAYEERLYNSIIANDNNPKMVTLCLANFLLKSLNESLLYFDSCQNLNKSDFKVKKGENTLKIQPTKAILNPPYEDSFKPLEIVEKNIELVKESGTKGHKVVVIIPPQKFGQKKDVFFDILNNATLVSVIKMQPDLFIESGKAQPTSIFVFDTSKPHSKNDVVHYYNFTDTGYVYLKDSGLVDKSRTYEEKKKQLLDKIKNSTNTLDESKNERTWTNFYDVHMELETGTRINPDKVKINSDEADITLENITIKKMLKEKQSLIDSVNNEFVDTDGSFEKYMINILSED